MTTPSTNVNVQYGDNDFIYKLVENYPLMPSGEQCAGFKTTHLSETECEPTGANFAANSTQCIQQELCKNKEFSVEINKTQQDYLGSMKMMTDKTQIFDNQVAQIQNMCFGFVIMLVTFYQTM